MAKIIMEKKNRENKGAQNQNSIWGTTGEEFFLLPSWVLPQTEEQEHQKIPFLPALMGKWLATHTFF